MTGELVIESWKWRSQAEAVPGHGIEYFDCRVVPPGADTALCQAQEWIHIPERWGRGEQGGDPGRSSSRCILECIQDITP